MKNTRLETESLTQSTPLKAYESPVVATFGSVSRLTQGVGGSLHDAGKNNNTKHGKG
jgi:hypothetical protein